jgi:2-amino-4-hydroxy-6-hydroxymethyldihydropteridine diphosphokinase
VARAFVGLGSNLGDREATIGRALKLLDERPGLTVLRVSRLRETEPWGYAEQPAFLNGAALVEIELGPHELLAALLAVEQELGRTRDDAVRYGPRTIDLDLLLYDDLEVDEPGLTLPHPRLHERLFVLEPLYDLEPELVIPGHGSLADVLSALHSDA